MNRPKRISKDLFIFAILTVITVFTWGFLDAYRAWQKKEIPIILKQQIEPLNPEFDVSVLESLSKRIKIER